MMEDIVLVCGRWNLERTRWVFCVDKERGCRVLSANGSPTYDEFVAMVMEDFFIDSRMYYVELSYFIPRVKQCRCDDTPPVFVANERQFEAYLRRCKVQSIRLCVEIKEHKSGKPTEDRDPNPKKRKIRVSDEAKVGEEKKKKREEDVDSEKKLYRGVEEVNKGEGEGEDRNEKEDCERFDYCDDVDGASSGDEDYKLYSNFSKEDDEVSEPEVMNDGVDDDEEMEYKRENQTKVEIEKTEEMEYKKMLDEDNIKYMESTKKRDRDAKYSMSLELAGVDVDVGQRFDSKDCLETRMKILSVVQKFDFNVERSRPHLYIVKCWVRGCKWRLRASTHGCGSVFYIRKYSCDHTCSVTERSARSRQATPDILAVMFKDFVGGVGSGVLPIHVGEGLKKRFGLKVDYWKARRTLNFARELVKGTSEYGYESLPAYLYKIRKANPGTLSNLIVDDADRFKYVFLAFGASIHGFQYMRKVVVVDGTFLKGKYKGTLLLATTQDGNFNIFPLTFAVVDTENDESWEWFFRELSRVIPDDEGLAIISDRHKSIGRAIGNVFPLASRGVCTYHLHKNIILKFRGSETFRLVKRAASAFWVADFDVLFQQIQALNPELHTYLVSADVSQWTRAHFPGDRYNFTTSNIAESLNKVFNPARSYPIVELLDAIRYMLTRWFANRRKQANSMKTTLTKGVEKLLEVRVENAKYLDVQEIGSQQYEVSSGTSTHVVHLIAKTCTCRKFDLEKIPCTHAIAAAEKAKVSRINLCHPYYRTNFLSSGYAKLIMPKDSSSNIPESIGCKNCKPPLIRKQPGRPKVTRSKCAIEIAMKKKCPRKTYTCSKCGNAGHNKSTCPG